MGYQFLDKSLYDDAILYFEKGLAFRNGEAAYVGKGKALMKLERCHDAKIEFLTAHKINPHNLFILGELSRIALECDKNEAEALRYEKLLEEERQKRESTFK